MDEDIRIANEMLRIAKSLVAGELNDFASCMIKLKNKQNRLLGTYARFIEDMPQAMKKMTVGQLFEMLYAIAANDPIDDEGKNRSAAGGDGVVDKDELQKLKSLVARLKPKLSRFLGQFAHVIPGLPSTMKKMTVKHIIDILMAIAKGMTVDEVEQEEGQELNASVRTAGETASKDGKYGTKSEGWSGVINYNGTRGKVSNAIFELKNGRIVWTDGTWESGTWAYGLWKDGLWKNGTWQMGEWENGLWLNGTWLYGTWHYGIWKQDGDDAKSVWMNGTWKNGIWENGTHQAGWWEKGIWQNGVWNGGTFWTGTWNNGVWNDGLNWYGEFNGGTWNKGQWNEGVWKGGVWKGGFDKKKNWHPENASPNKWKSEK